MNFPSQVMYFYRPQKNQHSFNILHREIHYAERTAARCCGGALLGRKDYGREAGLGGQTGATTVIYNFLDS